jgi:kanamycin nucleotidyltransferase
VNARNRYCDALVAFGAQGSLARGEDGPYSDLELYAVVRGEADETHEVIHDGWKIEVDVCGSDTLLRRAAIVDEMWSITHQNLVCVLPLYDPTGFFAVLAKAVRSQPAAAFDAAIRQFVIDEVYEVIGKLRNARDRSEPPSPGFVFYVARLWCQLVGLMNRMTYPSTSRMLADSLNLAERPDGHETLCRLCLDGGKGDVHSTVEAAWDGLVRWLDAHGIDCAVPKLPLA